MTDSGIFPNDDWVVSTGEDEESAIIVRFRSSLPTPEVIERFSHVILISWAFEGRPENGLPTSEQLSDMDEFEDLVQSKIQRDPSWAADAAVITAPGVREWRMFTPDPQIFIEGLNHALNGYGPYPLEIEALSDPDWVALVELQEAGSSGAEPH